MPSPEASKHQVAANLAERVGLCIWTRKRTVPIARVPTNPTVPGKGNIAVALTISNAEPVGVIIYGVRCDVGVEEFGGKRPRAEINVPAELQVGRGASTLRIGIKRVNGSLALGQTQSVI